jgi:hypothetical protein
MADQSFADWVLDLFKGPRSTRTEKLLAKSREIAARTDEILADAALEARGFRKVECEVDGQLFETSDPSRKRCNDHLGSAALVRRAAVCDFPGCGDKFETFSDGRSPDRTRCNDHAGRTPR